MSAIGLLAILGIVVIAVSVGSSSNSKKVAVPGASGSTTVAPATTATTTVPQKPCVGLKDAIPKGALSITVPVGPAPTSLIKNDIKVGTGATASAVSTVTVAYTCVACSSGKVFDSSPTTQFPLSGVIPGWQQGIPGMKVGGERVLGIPSSLAYGSRGFAPNIAPDEALWFAIKLQKVG